MATLDFRNRAPTDLLLPDSRLRVTRVADVLNYAAKTPAELLAEVWLDWGTQDAQFPNCRLILQSVEGQPTQFPDDSKKPPYLTRVYEEIAQFAETPVGLADVTIDQYDNTIVTQEWIQFSAGTVIYQIPGVTAAQPPFEDAILREEVRTNDGTLQRIKRTYTTGGILADNEELKFDGKLVMRTIRSLNEIPATPSGFTLVTQSTEFVRGLPLYSYGFASASGSIGLGGEVGRNVQYNLSPDQGATGVTVTTITYLTDASVVTNPITGPVGSELIQASYTDESGFRTWRAVYASGQGTISTNKDTREGGALIIYSTTAINAAPTTPAATIGGVVTLIKQSIRNGSDAAAGTVIYDFDWAEGNGEASRAFTNSNGGAVDFNPAAPTSSIGPVTCTIRYLTALSVTDDPTTRPAGFVRVAVDHEDANGYRVWTVRYGYGVGLIVDDEDYRNQGRLTVFHRVALGAPPATPTNLAEDAVTAIVLTNPGSGYTSAPTVSFTGGGGTGAVAVAVMAGTTLASITLTGGGSGYKSAPVVSITGGGGSGAIATASLTPTTVGVLTLTNGGSGYTTAPTVAFTGGGGTGATATAAIASSVLSATITNAGTGYTSTPTVGFSGGGGTGATGVASLTGGGLASATLTNAGSGYTSAPTVTVVGGGGTGAVVTAVLATTSVASVALTSGGTGVLGSAPVAAFSGGAGSGAAATVNTSGGIGGLTLVAAGTGYADFFVPTLSGGGGSGAVVYGWASGGVILGFSVEVIGSGYTSAPTVDLSPGGGTGGSATVSLYGGIARFAISSYSGPTTTPPTVSFTGGGGSGATGGVLVYDDIPYGYISNPGTGYSSAPTPNYSGGSFTVLVTLLTRPDSAITGLTLTAGGTGYTSVPAIAITASGLSGASGTVTLTPTTIASLVLSSAGSGYTSAPTLSFSGGGGSGGAGTAAITTTTVASITITSQGSGYTSAPTIALTGGGGTGATATANLAPAVVLSITKTASGSGYTSAPTISFSGGAGTGAAATAALTGTSLASIALSAPGAGYTGVPTISFSGGSGAGATASAALSPTEVDSVQIISGGSGYTTAPVVAFSAGTAAAYTTISAITGTVVLISAKYRTEDGYDVYDYQWAQGIGVISEDIQQRELGLRLEAWTALGDTYDASFMKPPGILMSKDFAYEEGFTRWVVVCMQNSAGADPTAGDSVASIEITSLGNFDYGSPPTLTFSGGGGSGAAGVPIMSAGTSGFVTGATVTNPGSGYTSPPIIVVSGGTSDVPQLVAILDNIALTREKLMRFTYPGRAQAVALTNPDITNSWNMDIQLSPPIDVDLIGQEEISYSTENTISNLTYPYYTPLEWATVFAQYRGSSGPTSEIQGLRGYRAVGGVSPVTVTPSASALVSILGHPVTYGASESAYLRVFGGPDAPDGITFTLEAQAELAFVALDGTQYFRRTVGFAVVPPQNPLPVLTSVTMISTTVTSISTLKAVVTAGAPGVIGGRTNAFRYAWEQGGVIFVRYVRATLTAGTLAADTTFWIKPTDYDGSTNAKYWILA